MIFLPYKLPWGTSSPDGLSNDVIHQLHVKFIVAFSLVIDEEADLKQR